MTNLSRRGSAVVVSREVPTSSRYGTQADKQREGVATSHMQFEFSKMTGPMSPGTLLYIHIHTIYTYVAFGYDENEDALCPLMYPAGRQDTYRKSYRDSGRTRVGGN